MNLTESILKRIIVETMSDMESTPESSDREQPSIEVKKQIYANMNKLRGNTLPFEELEVWEVKPGDYGYDSDINVTVDGKQFYGEI